MHLLLVAPSDSYRLGPYLGAAGALGCDVTVATDAAPALPGSAITVSLVEPERAAATIVAAAPAAIDGVVGTDGAAVAVAGAVARRLGKSANPAGALAAAADKGRQRAALDRAGVPQPAFAVLGDDRWDRFPAVVKPVDRTGSQGVIRVDTSADLRRAAVRLCPLVGPDAPLLVEEYVPGTEVVVEGLLQGGELDVLAVFDKPDTPAGPTFPETLLVTPSRFPPAVVDNAVSVVARAAAAIGLGEGPVHAECIVGSGGGGETGGGEVWFLELAARTIGGQCSDAVAPGGLSLEEHVVRHALGLERPRPRPSEPSGVLMLPVPSEGRLAAVHGVDEARAVPGITGVTISVRAHERVLPLPAGDRYLGFVFARGPSAAAVEDALRRAWDLLEPEISAW